MTSGVHSPSVLINYFSHGFSYLVILWSSPILLDFLGPEGWGIVSLLALTQMWLSILDAGVTPTITHVLAKDLNKSLSENTITIAHSLRTITFGFSSALFLCVVLFLNFISSIWFNDSEYTLTLRISYSELTLIILLIGLIRLNGFVSRAILLARQLQVQVAISEIFINLVRYPATIMILRLLNSLTVENFLLVQLFLALIELFLFGILQVKYTKIRFFIIKLSTKAILPIRNMLIFTAGSSIIWLFLSQLDRLIYSSILSLEHFGYFTLVITICSLVLGLPAPLGRYILPLMTSLIAKKKYLELTNIYRNSTRLIVCITAPFVSACMIYPDSLMSLWLPEDSAVIWTSSILPLYIFISFLVAVSTFQYQVQVASGNLRYHFTFNIFAFLLTVPIVIYSANYNGVYITTIVILILRLIPFLVWSQFIHKKFLKGVGINWFINDILIYFALSYFLIWLLNQIVSLAFPLFDFSILISILVTTILLLAPYFKMNAKSILGKTL